MVVRLPFDRERLRERNRIDEEQDLEDAVCATPDERFALGLQQSDLARALARAAGAAWLEQGDDLEEEARLYAIPLRRLLRA